VKPKVLFIDDDLDLCELIKLMLTRIGFEVETANNGLEGLKKAYTYKPEVIVLDVMMPDMDGWQTCKRFREMTDVPIIMLTALGSQEEVIKGLNLGADDYLVKPITADELAARIRALLRRMSRSDTENGRKSRPIFSQDDLVIDLDKYEVTRGGQRIDLSPTEFKLLSVLVKYKGRVLPHEFLLTEVWGVEYVSEIDYLRLYISYLRRKLEDDPSNPTLIHNEWGVGYRFG
jgi:two-component system KDP operon response regulator KdpE